MDDPQYEDEEIRRTKIEVLKSLVAGGEIKEYAGAVLNERFIPDLLDTLQERHDRTPTRRTEKRA